MTTHTPICEQFCDKPIGSDGEPATENTLACCIECRRLIRWLSHDVLPSIRRYGYYCPADGDVDDEIRAMIEQRGLNELMELLKELVPEPITGSWRSQIPIEETR